MHIVLGLLFILVGGFAAISTKSFIKLQYWRRRDFEPTGFIVIFYRVLGLAFVAAGIISCFNEKFLGSFLG